MSRTFAVSWDYLCPFARNAHEHVLAGLEAGAEWEVTFTPFSLAESHVEEGDPSIFDVPDDTGLLHALAAGVAVRDHYPEHFARLHRAMFAARHDEGRNLRDQSVVRDLLSGQGVDPDAVMAHSGESIATLRDAHRASVADHAMFGVPTFVMDGRAVFVRLMDRPGTDLKKGVESIEAVLRLLEEMPSLNEFKYTKIPR